MKAATPDEFLIVAAARLLAGCRHVAVGANSPIPAGAALLARALAGPTMRVSLLGSRRHNFFTNGGVELFDCAAEGRIDAFFLGGGQIDGQGNVNLVGTGAYPQTNVRWPGSFGAPFLYHFVPRVILFRPEHSPRVLVEKVDFVSAPGPAPDDRQRPGGPRALLTGMALFRFERERGRFRLESVHPGRDADEVRAATGFAYDQPERVPETTAPDAAVLALWRETVCLELSETYPRFMAPRFAGTGPSLVPADPA